MTRIVHIQLLPLLTGAQRVSLDIFGALAEKPGDWDCHLITSTDGAFPDEARRLGVHTHCCPRMVRPIRPIKDYLAYRSLKAMLRELKPDIVHTHSSKPGVLGRLAARATGVPTIIHTVHGYAFGDNTPKLKRAPLMFAERVAGRATDALVVVNNESKRIALTYNLATLDRIRVIPNGVPDPSPISKDDLRSRLIEICNIPADAKLIGSVGRLWAQKNVSLQIRAAAVLKKTQPDAYWIIIGDGPDSNDLAALASSLNVSDRVHFLGWRSDASELTGGLDIFVQTSRYEGCSLTMLDAMARALPIVSTNARGSNELIIDGQTGILTPMDDPSAVASAIDRILSDPSIADSLGQAARDRQRLAFSYETYRQAYVELYHSFTNSR